MARLKDAMTRVSLQVRDVVYEAHGPITEVDFPLSGVMSMVIIMDDGASVEVGTVGNEGMVGTAVFLGAETSHATVFAQVAGEAMRLPVGAFKRELADVSGVFFRRIARYQQALVTQISQSVACNHAHSVDERTARWLLMTHDRVASDEFSLTQEFLAQMLGVRRPSVTVAAGLLEKAGLITYTRGRITILDRERLEAASCECYRTVRAQFEALLRDV